MTLYILCFSLFIGAMSMATAGEYDPDRFMPVDQIRRGMKGYGLTVFEGTTIDTFQAEILGVLEGIVPKGDLILARLSGGPLEHTGIFGGMSGSPVYIDGKLAGAISLRVSTFSPDSICGITPVELMLELNEFDEFLPGDARTPTSVMARSELAVPGDVWAQAVGAGGTCGSVIRPDPS